MLDEMGADRLLGNGDMLFLIPGHVAHHPCPGNVCLGCRGQPGLPVPRALPGRVQPRADAAPGRRRARRQGAGRRAQGARRALRAGHRDRDPRGPRLVLAACSGRWESATAAPPGSSTSWPRTASSASSRAARPARSSTPGRSGKPSRTAGAASSHPRRRREHRGK